MNTSKYRFSLEVQESQSNVCLDVKRGDTKSRTLLITLTDGGFPYHISDECYAVFAATKPDGKKVFNDCVIEDDTIIYELTPQTTAAAGCAECEIRLYGADDKLLTSPGFLIAVHDTTFHDGDVVESETETNTLNRLISDAVEEYMDENDVGGGSGGLTVYTLAEGESIDDAPADADIIHDPYTEPEASGGGLTVYTLAEGETVDDAPADADIIHDPYTEPEIPEADISMNVEGASVGQIVKIASVDDAGKPTAWEAVEMPSLAGDEWKNVADITVETDVTQYTIVSDDNGEEFSLAKAKLVVFAPAQGTVGYASININDVSKPVDSSWSQTIFRAADAFSIVDIELTYGVCVIRAETATIDNTTGSYSYKNAAKVFYETSGKIRSVSIRHAAGVGIPAGTRFVLMGVKT